MIRERSLDFEMAERAVEATLQARQPTDPPIAVAVVDAHGELVLTARMDGTSPIEIRQAMRKAYTSAHMGRDTKALHEQLLGDGRTIGDWADPAATTLAGGLVARVHGEVVGGLGVSGSGVRDEELARSGLEAMESST